MGRTTKKLIALVAAVSMIFSVVACGPAATASVKSDVSERNQSANNSQNDTPINISDEDGMDDHGAVDRDDDGIDPGGNDQLDDDRGDSEDRGRGDDKGLEDTDDGNDAGEDGSDDRNDDAADEGVIGQSAENNRDDS